MATMRTAGGAALSFRHARRACLRQRRSRRSRALQFRRIRVLRDGTLAALDEDMGMMRHYAPVRVGAPQARDVANVGEVVRLPTVRKDEGQAGQADLRITLQKLPRLKDGSLAARTSALTLPHLVCRLLLEKKKKDWI